ILTNRQPRHIQVICLPATARKTHQPTNANRNSAEELRDAERMQPRIEQKGSGAVTGDVVTTRPAAKCSRSLGTQHSFGTQPERCKGDEFVPGSKRDGERQGTIIDAAAVVKGPDRSHRVLGLEAEPLTGPARCSAAEQSDEQA